jgi:hypothetical protein
LAFVLAVVKLATLAGGMFHTDAWSETPGAKCLPCEVVRPLNGDTNLYSFDYLHNYIKTVKKTAF